MSSVIQRPNVKFSHLTGCIIKFVYDAGNFWKNAGKLENNNEKQNWKNLAVFFTKKPVEFLPPTLKSKVKIVIQGTVWAANPRHRKKMILYNVAVAEV